MLFRISGRHENPVILKSGFNRFLQNTALVSASLLFCIFGVPAYAEDLYYNYNSPDGGLDPQTGGIWAQGITGPAYWFDLDDNEFVRFFRGDVAYFRAKDDDPNGDHPISVALSGRIDASDIFVERGTFRFGNGGSADLTAKGLSVVGNARLNLDTAIRVINNPVNVAGFLYLSTNGLLDAEDGILVSSGGTLGVFGQVTDGSVTLDTGAGLMLRSGGSISKALIINGSGFDASNLIADGTIGSLEVTGAGDAVFGSDQTVVQGAVDNSGALTLAGGTYGGDLNNDGTLSFAQDITIGDGITAIVADNRSGATISTLDGDRTLTVNGVFNSAGTLQGAAADTLTIAASDAINISGSTIFSGNVVLSGAINNLSGSDLDLAYVPRLGGTFTNENGATARVTSDVDGNNNDFVNEGALEVNGADLTALVSLTNDGGSVNVAASRTLAATTINHVSGSFVSEGILVGDVIANDDASISGVIEGDYQVTGGTTTVSDDLDMSAGAGVIRISGGSLDIAAGATINGDVVNARNLTGSGRITGDLTVDTVISSYRGSGLTVDGALVIAGSFTGLLSQVNDILYENVTYTNLINRGTLDVNQDATAINVTNAQTGTLRAYQAMGNLTSAGATYLHNDVTGALHITDGTTHVQSKLGATNVTVGGAAGNDLRIDAAGSLLVQVASLDATGRIIAEGRLDLASGYTITASETIISGDAGSSLRGTLNGALTVQDAGAVTLDGARITGPVVNYGKIEDDSGIFSSVELASGLTNHGEVTLGGTGGDVEITGEFRNTDLGVAIITGSVSGAGGNVVNSGTLTFTGDIANSLTNSGTAVIAGNIGAAATNTGTLTATGDIANSFTNSGTAVIAGNIGAAATNTGTLTFMGDIANSLTNSGTATITGNIGTTATNTGTLNLTAAVTQAIQNNGTDATLNIVGDSSADNVTGAGTVNILDGATLTLTRGSMVNGSEATLNIAGTLASDLENQGSVELVGNAVVGGALTNRAALDITGAGARVTDGIVNAADGVLTVTGSVTADVTNQADGRVNLNGAGRIIGAVVNEADATFFSGSAEGIEGDVTNAGTFTVDLFTQVDGDFLNSSTGLVNQTADDSRLLVTGTLTNNGTISTSGFQTFRISADTVVNNGTLHGDVQIDGDLSNNGTQIYDVDSDLIGDLENSSVGVVRVQADVTGNGSNHIGNNGIFSIDSGGSLTNVDTVENWRTFTISDGGSLNAQTFLNHAGTLSNNGVLTADITNESGAVLLSSGSIVGDVLNQGEASLSGSLRGNLSTDDTADDLTRIVADLDVDGDVTNRGTFRVADTATLSASGPIANRASGNMVVNGNIVGNLDNAGTLDLHNGLTGDLSNSGTAVVTGVIDGGAANSGDITLSGRVTGDLSNSGTAVVAGVIDGDAANSGDITLSGRVTGELSNRDDGDAADDVIRIANSLRAGSVTNRGGSLIVEAGRTLSVDAALFNTDTGALTIQGDVSVGQTLINNSSTRMVIGEDGTLTGDLRNEASARLAGTINGDVVNQGTANASGTISGDLTNEGARFVTGGDLVVSGSVVNRPHTSATGMSAGSGQAQRAVGAPTNMIVASDTQMTVNGGVTNQSGANLTVDGVLVSGVTNEGTFALSRLLRGDLVNSGHAKVQGRIEGNVTARAGSSLQLDGDLQISGVLDSFVDFGLAADRRLDVSRYVNRRDTTLNVAGRLGGLVRNFGTLNGQSGGAIASLQNTGEFFVDRAFTIDGSMQNSGVVKMTGNGTAGDVLTVNGDLSGNGTYKLDLDMEADGGKGASDRVVVRGGAVTGAVTLSFRRDTTVAAGMNADRRILVFDVDGSRENNFEYTAENLPAASERIIYSVLRDGSSGDLYLTDTVNPALGGLAGNLTLTQSLIGSVVNRPSSPYVPGLAGGAGDKPCGAGAWARTVAGRASATGQTSNGSFAVGSSIEASYRGLQFGSDIACFDGKFKGWDVAMGVFGGVNDGTTTQPVYLTDPLDPSQLSNVLASVNHGDFRQVYGGIYATASKGHWFVDLQARREKTGFTINNVPVGDNSFGLRLRDSDFDTRATTVSGSVSYAYSLPREGWTLVPTAGFAFSNLSADVIRFEDNAELQIEDSKSRVGFIGGTLSKTFVNQQRNSVIHAFGTATVYKDFAPETASIFTIRNADGSINRQNSLVSSNLGTYGELSLGVNYTKVLNAGKAGAPRQFNASIRLDGRTGDVLDSYGVSAQVRLQF